MWTWVAFVTLVGIADLRAVEVDRALRGSVERGDGLVTLF